MLRWKFCLYILTLMTESGHSHSDPNTDPLLISSAPENFVFKKNLYEWMSNQERGFRPETRETSSITTKTILQYRSTMVTNLSQGGLEPILRISVLGQYKSRFQEQT